MSIYSGDNSGLPFASGWAESSLTNFADSPPAFTDLLTFEFDTNSPSPSPSPGASPPFSYRSLLSPRSTGTSTWGVQPASSLATEPVRLKCVPTASHTVTSINCDITTRGRVMFSVNSSGASTTVKDCARRRIAAIQWFPSTVVDIRAGGGAKWADQWLVYDYTTNAHMWEWKGGEYYIWTGNGIAGDDSLFLYSQSNFDMPLATVRASGLLFDIELSPEAIKKSIVEPIIVSLLLIKQSRL